MSVDMLEDIPTESLRCKKLWIEASELKADALITSSVRRNHGTNLPIFTRSSIGDPEVIEWVSVTYDPQNDRLIINSL